MLKIPGSCSVRRQHRENLFLGFRQVVIPDELAGIMIEKPVFLVFLQPLHERRFAVPADKPGKSANPFAPQDTGVTGKIRAIPAACPLFPAAAIGFAVILSGAARLAAAGTVFVLAAYAAGQPAISGSLFRRKTVCPDPLVIAGTGYRGRKSIPGKDGYTLRDIVRFDDQPPGRKIGRKPQRCQPQQFSDRFRCLIGIAQVNPQPPRSPPKISAVPIALPVSLSTTANRT